MIMKWKTAKKEKKLSKVQNENANKSFTLEKSFSDQVVPINETANELL